MKKLSQRETIILSITLGLSAVFLVYLWVIRPVKEGAADIDDQLRVTKARLLKSRQVLGQGGMIETRYHNLADAIGLAGSEETQAPAIISKIEAAARESNIHIANIQPQRSFIQKEASFFPVELEIDGQWLDIVQFLRALQDPPNFYFINALNLEKYSDASGSLRGRIVVARMSLMES